MRDYLNSICGFYVPDQFVEITSKFQNKFGDKETAIEKVGQYIGFDFIVDQSEARSYEGAPFEIQLPFATGGDGEHMGWLSLSPEISNFHKPFVTWSPGSGAIWYHGIDLRKVFAILIKNIHEAQQYKEIDLDFLSSIDIHPKTSNSIVLSTNYESDKLQLIPILIEKNWQYEMTLDGVGVYAHSKWFSPDQAIFKEKKSVREIFELAKIQQQKKFHASAIYLIKNGISENLINSHKINLFPNFYELVVKSYEEIGRKETAKIVHQQLKIIKQYRAK